MAAPDVELADAIVADLNHVDRGWSLSFTSERVWVPLWVGEEELSDLQCLVCPWPVVEVEPQDRDTTRSEYSVDIGFAQRLESKTRAEIDALVALVYAVSKRYPVLDFTVAGVGRFVGLRRLDEYVTFDPTRLNRVPGTTEYAGDFLSMMRVPFRLLEP